MDDLSLREDGGCVQRYRGVPNQPERENEIGRWKRFLEWLIPPLKQKWHLGERLLEAQVRQEEGKAMQEEGRGLQEILRARQMEEDARTVIEIASIDEERDVVRSSYDVLPDEDNLLQEIELVEQKLALLKKMQLLRLKYGTQIQISAELDKDESEVARIRELLQQPIDALDLSVQVHNLLKAANIETIGGLLRLKESDLLKFRNFGRENLQELIQVLDENGLHFGMDVSSYLKEDDFY